MKKLLSLILILTGIASSVLIQGAESFEIRAARAAEQKALAQKPLTAEEIAIEEEQASLKRLAQKKRQITEELENRAQQQELEREQKARQQAIQALQDSTERAKKAAEEWRMTAAKIGSSKSAVIEPLEETGTETALTPERAAQIRANLERSSERARLIGEGRTGLKTMRTLAKPAYSPEQIAKIEEEVLPQELAKARQQDQFYKQHPANIPPEGKNLFSKLPEELQEKIIIQEAVNSIEMPELIMAKLGTDARVSKQFIKFIATPSGVRSIAHALVDRFKIPLEDAYIAIGTPLAEQELHTSLLNELKNPAFKQELLNKLKPMIVDLSKNGSLSHSREILLQAALETKKFNSTELDLTEERSLKYLIKDIKNINLTRALINISDKEAKNAALSEILLSYDQNSLAIVKELLEAGANPYNEQVQEKINFASAVGWGAFQEEKMRLINEYRQRASVLPPQTR